MGGCRPPSSAPAWWTPDSRSLGLTSAGPRLLDDVFHQPVDPLVQCQAPEERDLSGRGVVSRSSVPAGHRPAPKTWPLIEFPSPAGEPPGSSRRLHTPPERWWHGGKAQDLDEMARPLPWRGGSGEQWEGLGWGDRLTHRVQLPLEYDEGHETDNDKYRAEAQVGKEVAREITWVRQGKQDEDRT